MSTAATDPRATGAEADDGGLAVFAALADPTRRHVLEMLVALRSASATHLAARLPVSRQAVLKHLHVLEDAGLVGGRRSGREVIYVARIGALRASARWLIELSESCRAGIGPTTPSPDISSLTPDPPGRGSNPGITHDHRDDGRPPRANR